MSRGVYGNIKRVKASFNCPDCHIDKSKVVGDPCKGCDRNINAYYKSANTDKCDGQCLSCSDYHINGGRCKLTF